MEVYLDNSATTRPYDEVAQCVYDTMLNNYANPSSLHSMGKSAEDLLESCRKEISCTLNCTPKELYFTCGGSQGDNLAIIGYAMANKKKGNKIISQKTEHKAVLEALNYLETQGFEICLLDVDSEGFVDINQLKNELTENTLLVSIMYANNENGAIQPVESIARLTKKSGCAFHIDAVQAYGKTDINVKKAGADMVTLSAHKIHGPNGIGAIYVKNGIRLQPVVFGGQQESGLISGTENLSAIAGFAKAVEIRFSRLEQINSQVEALKNRLKKGLLNAIENIDINTPENSINSILNVSFTGVKSEVLLHVLESKGIYVSTGSACNSKKNRLSYVLKAMNLRDSSIDSAIRFSLSEFNTEEEIDYTVEVLKNEVETLRKIMR